MINKTTCRFWWLICIAAALIVAASRAATNVITDASLVGTNTWHRTNTYILSGLVHVQNNSVLHIEAGTVVKGRNLPGTEGDKKGGLVICRGGKIFANGTANNPIIFTAEIDDVFDPEDLGIYQRGLWGGVVILGRARLNSAVNSTGNAANPVYELFEGLLDTQVGGEHLHFFGGDDDNDNSGVFRYVSIRHGGAVIEAAKELNGLSLGGVGRGTTIEFVETYATADDGFEFFGGTVNTRYLISAFNDDDAFDADQGHSGKHQFWFAVQPPVQRNYGFELNGEPNTLTGPTPRLPHSNFELYNATIIGAGVGNTGTGGDDNTFKIREYSAPRVYNSIFTDFARRGIEIDAKSGFFLTNGTLQLENNLWFGFTGGANPNSVTNLAVDARAEILFTDTARSNLIVNPQLRGISRTNDGGLDPRPAAGSPALTAPTRTVPNDGFFTQTDYLGAFGANDLWIGKWSALSHYEIIKPNGSAATNVITDASLVGTNTWHRTNTYILSGLVHVRSNSVLHIEAGTVVKGRNLPGTEGDKKGGLVICRGGKIFANGTANNPIIFTAEIDDVFDPEDLGIYQRGLWGGVVILGRARLNSAVNSTGNAANPVYELFEGLLDTQVGGEHLHFFGGDDDNDNSGVFRYVSIRHGGAVIEAAKELNGLSLGGVGRGTTIEFVETYATADDGFEFFGGTVNTRYLISAFNDDDAFDADQGHSGKHQFWFAVQPPVQRNYGFELNGEPNTLTGPTPRLPHSNFELYNATIIGAGVGNTGTGGDDNTFKIREYSAPRVYNSIFTDFARRGIEIDAKSGFFLTNGTLQLENNLWFGFTGGANPNSVTNLAVDARAEILFTDTARSNLIVNPQLRGISRTNDGGLDPRPAAGSPALTAPTRTVPNDGFFTQTDYLGAFGAINWASDWTTLGDYAVITGAGAGVPTIAPVVPPTPNQPSLAVSAAGGNLQISFTSEAGVTYQLQSATSLSNLPAGWANDGPPMSGTGGILTFTPTINPGNKFFRVIAP